MMCLSFLLLYFNPMFNVVAVLLAGSTEALRAAAPPLRRPSTRVLSSAADDDGLVVSPARTMAQALRQLWETVARYDEVSLADPMDDATAIVFPECAPLRSNRIWAAFFEHLECCKDVCDRFGTKVVAMPSADGEDRALVVRRVRGQRGDEEEEDDDDDWELSPELAAKLRGLDDEEPVPEAAFFKEDDDDDDAPDNEILAVSRRWVDAIVSGAGVCPFSVNADNAGLPVGKVRYEISRAADAESAYAAYWHEVDLIQTTDVKALSTTLLVLADRRWAYNLEEFETLGTTLAQALEGKGLGFEEDLQLVFFHPAYAFRDGRERAGSDGAANFARRSPYPMVNILRTKQVRDAQRSLPTALVYAQNEATLADIGADLLGDMLHKRDWSPIDGRRVDRKAIEVLRIAQDLMRQSDAAANK
ncbi:hypothetical protein CTAYLR_005431 [Chrysophaeum taylorii]|uniref:Uncharacterized protein n=1 Tax=Chrysophaeum taylorii TaxID=2483200 RepID=A0AAD7UJM2_9STRA|nr:hypothetical protein CTAYLR_005431 [Chrysophaeum taylorii]